MPTLPSRCPTPHPIRGSGRRDHQGDIDEWAADIEIIGGYEDSAWVRCRRCGAWFWVVTDNSRFAYANEWRLPASAEAILGSREPGPIVDLLVSQGLPHGPLWELGSARLGLLRHLTPGHDDVERIAALAAQVSLPLAWQDALALVRDEHAAAMRRVVAPPLAFLFDLQRDMSGCEELFELPGALIAPLREPACLLRFTPEGAVEIPLAGPPKFLAATDDRLLLQIEGPSPALVLLRPDTMLALQLGEPLELRAAFLDRGHVLLMAQREPSSDGRQRIDLRDASLEFVASIAIELDPRSPYPAPPRAMGEGWIVPNAISQAGEVISLCLFDASWQPLALAREGAGARTLEVLDEQRVIARPLAGPGRVELWRRRGEAIERELELACFAHVVVGAGIDARLIGVEGGFAFATTLDGTPVWRRSIDALAPELHALAGCVVIACERSIALLDPTTGHELARVEGPFADELFLDQSGWAHRMLADTLIRCSPTGTIERTPLDAAYELVGVAGEGVILRGPDEGARHLWIAGTGALLGEFEAPTARWSVVGSHAGPHVLERERLRVRAIRR